MQINNYGGTETVSELLGSSYFAASDPDFTPFLSDDAFETSLVINSLIQDRLVIPDWAFFRSDQVAAHVLRNKSALSLLEMLIRTGAVIPAFRVNLETKEPIQSFTDAFAAINGKWTVAGRGAEVARLLDRALKAGLDDGKASFISWPEDISEQFATRAVQLLQAPIPACLDKAGNRWRRHQLRNNWRDTETFRVACLNAALEETLRNGGTGLQRTVFLKVMGKALGVPEDACHNIYTLSSSLPAPQRKSVVLVNTWLTQIYHYTQALGFGAAPVFSGFDLGHRWATDLVPLSVLPAQPSLPAFKSVPSIELSIDLPLVEYLTRISASKFVSIREDAGPGYRDAVKNWFSKPDNGDELKAIAQDYAFALKQSVERNEPQSNGRLVIYLLTGVNVGLNIAWGWADTQNRAEAISSHLPDEFKLATYGALNAAFAAPLVVHKFRKSTTKHRAHMWAPTELRTGA